MPIVVDDQLTDVAAVVRRCRDRDDRLALVEALLEQAEDFLVVPEALDEAGESAKQSVTAAGAIEDLEALGSPQNANATNFAARRAQCPNELLDPVVDGKHADYRVAEMPPIRLVAVQQRLSHSCGSSSTRSMAVLPPPFIVLGLHAWGIGFAQSDVPW
jgi:hypothetical protein